MKSLRLGTWFALGLTVVAAFPAFAASKPVNLSLFTPISLAKAEDAVTAFRFDFIYGRNTSVNGLDLGLINHTTSGKSGGLEWGGINYTQGDFSGVQLGAVNYNQGSAGVFQWGAFNYAQSANGLQLALINYAGTIKGVQIGAINIISKGGFLPVCIIANWGK